jgi:hypothetical protein
MVQKKRQFINGKSVVEVIYRKNGKSPRKLNESPKSGDRSDQTWNPDDYGNIQSKKKVNRLETRILVKMNRM